MIIPKPRKYREVSVIKAMNRRTGEIVAIKKMKKKYFKWQECVSQKEVQDSDHKNRQKPVKKATRSVVNDTKPQETPNDHEIKTTNETLPTQP